MDNTGDRLQTVIGSEYFIIIRRASDGKVFKSIITSDNAQDIEALLQECADGQLYDAVIRSNEKHEGLGAVRLRSLTYFKINGSAKITLKHPENLISAHLRMVKIVNLGQCAELANLYSWENEYVREDIAGLCGLRRICSSDDKY